MTPVTFKYLNISPLAGRGGVQRFFMLSNGIPFTEELFTPGPDSWGVEKLRMIESGENPCGTVPLLIIKSDDGEDKHFTQHIAGCRYMARINNLDTGDHYKDYVQDLVADEYHEFRGQWAHHNFSASDEEKEEYKKDGLIKQLSKFEALYIKYATAAPYLSVNSAGKPLWGDSAIFGLVYDLINTGFLSPEDLSAYPKVLALHEAYGAIPEVAAWIEEHKK